tara:strand:+ start:277 stop:459 length:183 start_codon:yes stop_codon:yes gene_type:complete
MVSVGHGLSNIREMDSLRGVARSLRIVGLQCALISVKKSFPHAIGFIQGGARLRGALSLT